MPVLGVSRRNVMPVPRNRPRTPSVDNMAAVRASGPCTLPTCTCERIFSTSTGVTSAVVAAPAAQPAINMPPYVLGPASVPVKYRPAAWYAWKQIAFPIAEVASGPLMPLNKARTPSWCTVAAHTARRPEKQACQKRREATAGLSCLKARTAAAAACAACPAGDPRRRRVFRRARLRRSVGRVCASAASNELELTVVSHLRQPPARRG